MRFCAFFIKACLIAFGLYCYLRFQRLCSLGDHRATDIGLFFLLILLILLFSLGCSVFGYFVFPVICLLAGLVLSVPAQVMIDLKNVSEMIDNVLMATFDHTTQLPSHCYALLSNWVFKTLAF